MITTINVDIMKRILIILTAALFSSASYSQVVMGRDTYTTSKKYAAFLATRGYKPYETVSGVKKFKVKFAGFTNVREEVHYDTSNDSITQVKFIFENRTQSELEDAYFTLLKQYKQKYPEGENGDMKWEGIDMYMWHYNPSKGSKRSIYLSIDNIKHEMKVQYFSNYEEKENKKIEISSDI